MYFINDGRQRILSPSDSFFLLFNMPFSWSSNVCLYFGSEFCFGIELGFRRTKKNVIASNIGMVDINNIVLTGDRPSEINAAYEKLPRIPAPP